MGDEPVTSVVDRHCKVHGTDNLYIADGSAHVTNGGFNPFLTIMANAHRMAEGIAQCWWKQKPDFVEIRFLIGYSFARSKYSPVRVSILSRSPSLIKFGA